MIVKVGAQIKIRDSETIYTVTGIGINPNVFRITPPVGGNMWIVDTMITEVMEENHDS